jgi:hypothetical protein
MLSHGRFHADKKEELRNHILQKEFELRRIKLHKDVTNSMLILEYLCGFPYSFFLLLHSFISAFSCPANSTLPQEKIDHQPYYLLSMVCKISIHGPFF